LGIRDERGFDDRREPFRSRRTFVSTPTNSDFMVIEHRSVADERGASRGPNPDRSPTNMGFVVIEHRPVGRRTRTSRSSSTDRSPNKHGLHGDRAWISSLSNARSMVVERRSLALQTEA
jgi:hypothetical protein